MDAGESPAQRAWQAFVAELSRWRTERGMSKKQLAAAMGFDPSYVSHIEALRHRPTDDFARRAEAVLHAGGAIWQRFREFDQLRGTGRSRNTTNMPTWGYDPPAQDRWLPPGTGLVVEHEIAELSYVDGQYRCRIRRGLYNAGTEPVTRYLVRIAVDRYPTQPERSNQYYRDNPLDWDALQLQASCAGEPMSWRAKTDRDASKDVWLLFENPEGHFPLYPERRAHIDYSYRVGADQWGQWFQRSIRLPTQRLTVRLDFPVSFGPVVWGLETSLATEAVPLRTPIEQEVQGDRAIFTWATDAALLYARYRIEWRFRTPPPHARGMVEAYGALDRTNNIRASERMRVAGIVQRGAEVLDAPAQPFSLPDEEQTARDVVARLFAALDHVTALHPFAKGVGLAAPQIDLARAAALVRPAGNRTEPIVLLNPKVVAESSEHDEQYEGCLSFFDVRGLVVRPLWIDVESELLNGKRVVARYEHGVARLIAHEIDHLHGRLYVDRMRPGTQTVPVEDYPETGHPWNY
jgi:peptide deformylase